MGSGLNVRLVLGFTGQHEDSFFQPKVIVWVVASAYGQDETLKLQGLRSKCRGGFWLFYGYGAAVSNHDLLSLQLNQLVDECVI